MRSGDRVRLHRRGWGHRGLRPGGPALPGSRRPGAAAGGGQLRADPRDDRAGRVAADSSARRPTGPMSPPPRRRPGRWPTRGAGPWAGRARSTPWRTCAGTGRCTTAGPRAARPGWGSRTCCRTSGAASSATGRDPALRGTAGPVRVGPGPGAHRHPVARAFAEALAQLGCPVTDDLSGAQQEGVAWADLAIDGGQRASPADAYLRPALDRPNLTVATGCLVTRLQIDRGRCTGVRYLRDGAPGRAHAAGGDRVRRGGRLAAAADAVRHRPGRPAPRAGHRPGGRPRRGRREPPGPPRRMASLRRRLAAAQRAGTTTARCTRRCAARWQAPGPTCTCSPILLPVAPARYPPPAAGFVLVAAAMAPDSRGSVRLASADPQRPADRPGFPARRRDLDRLEAGLLMARARRGHRRVHGLGGRGVARPRRPHQRRPAGLDPPHRRQLLPSGRHLPDGPPGRGAVVDPELRVRGIAGLRVADASVMPIIPNAHPNATVLAIAERAADLTVGR